MGMTDDLSRELHALAAACTSPNAAVQRIRAELGFAAALTAARPDSESERGPLILAACSVVRAALESGSAMVDAVREAEAVLAPIGRAAEQDTVHCVGHAHIDMNWQWPWPETVAVINDTFTTVDRLMDDFPEFRFSQSQASVYRALADYLPELRVKVKQRIAEGRWEITASQWVEGDKNLASGEALCRHALYTRRFLAEELGLPYDAVVIDFEPDTFGHARPCPRTLPGHPCPDDHGEGARAAGAFGPRRYLGRPRYSSHSPSGAGRRWRQGRRCSGGRCRLAQS